MNIDGEMVKRAMDEMDKRLMNNEWVDACEIARHNIAFEILDEAINAKAVESAPRFVGPVLILASYCEINDKCTEALPCLDCLKMSNVATVQDDGTVKVVGGYDYLYGKSVSLIAAEKERGR